MQIIVTHDVSDFDAFASCMAARRLYPGAVVVLSTRLSTAVRDFQALHKDRFHAVRHTDLDPREVTRMIVVDVHRRERLKAFAEVLERIDRGEVDVHVWDHHGATSDDLPASLARVERVGSTTTLLVEEIRRRRLRLDPMEATLYLIGIHSDTGSLTYAMSTPRDARAVAWLLERGASLPMLNRYLDPPFTPEQRRVLGAVLRSIEVERIAGVDIGISVVHLDEAVDGLADITSQAIDLHGLPALFGIFVLGGRRIQVVGRARRRWVNVARPIERIGGGGHPPAASAMVKDGRAGRIRRILLEDLRRDPPRPARVADLMSSPVHTVSPDTTVETLSDSLAYWHHTGAPVVRDGELVGIVSRRDVEKVADAPWIPVSGFMTHRIHTAEADEPIEDALARMVQHDVGRLPVMRDGRLVGILTRSDLLRVLYPAEEAAELFPSPNPPHGP